MKIGIVRMLLFLPSALEGDFHAKAGAPINFIGYKGPSIHPPGNGEFIRFCSSMLCAFASLREDFSNQSPITL
jgi:hypothetical protein